ncbi:MAG: 6-phosphogluconolactonase [Xanthomonadales bacterium]|nr:6-phosphogluconolactonase [Gammaproteobacteria bacterium]NNK05082.1 6-phosphogluconolactonase [Xanthomonadales bacterium]
MGSIDFQSYESRAEASAAAAELLAALVRKKLSGSPQAQASLVVSGGSTPGPCFDLLSREPLDWTRVTVMPSDERWVPADHPDSNERLIRSRLLQNRAARGNVLPLFRAGVEATQAPSLIQADLADTAQPFSAVLLGMGEDGHFASLFPDFEQLPAALEPETQEPCMVVQTASSPHLRISLTLSALLNSGHIVLLIFGAAKREVFETAKQGGSAYPVEALLRHSRKPLTVIWAG